VGNRKNRNNPAKPLPVEDFSKHHAEQSRCRYMRNCRHGTSLWCSRPQMGVSPLPMRVLSDGVLNPGSSAQLLFR